VDYGTPDGAAALSYGDLGGARSAARLGVGCNAIAAIGVPRTLAGLRVADIAECVTRVADVTARLLNGRATALKPTTRVRFSASDRDPQMRFIARQR
jgi:hypothetical protein